MKDKKKSLWQQMGRKTPDMVTEDMKIKKKKKEESEESSEKNDYWRRTHVFRKK